jgi:hypothetical protein
MKIHLAISVVLIAAVASADQPVEATRKKHQSTAKSAGIAALPGHEFHQRFPRTNVAIDDAVFNAPHSGGASRQ